MKMIILDLILILRLGSIFMKMQGKLNIYKFYSVKILLDDIDSKR